MKRIFRPLALIGVAIGLAACSTSGGPTSTTNTLTINADGSERPTFTRNFNFLSPAGAGTNATYLMYEPLVHLDVQQGNKIKPWLATSWAYSDGGKTLTFKLRTDVTWSDGKPFTAEDVKFTFEIPVKNPKLGAEPVGFSSVSTPDPSTVVIRYPKTAYHELATYSRRYIVPQHLWKTQELARWTNPDPVGTGPFVLNSFSPQQIQLKVRPNPWQGAFHGVELVNVKVYGSANAVQQALLTNQLSWSSIAWQDAQENFVDKGEFNHYGGFPGNGSEGILFNSQKEPTSNVHVRRALYWALDPAKLLELYDTGAKPANPNGLSNQLWKDYQAPELSGKVAVQQAAKAREELAKSGYALQNGNLVKNGKTYPLTVKAVAEYTNWTSYGRGMAQQWKDVLGLDVKPLNVPGTQLSSQKADGDFTVVQDFLNGGPDIYNALVTTLHSKYVPDGKPATGNYGRYRNATVDKLLNEMEHTNDPAILKRDAHAIQRAIVNDVPFGPLSLDGSFVEYNATDWTGWPDPKTATYQPRPWGPNGILTIQNLSPRKK